MKTLALETSAKSVSVAVTENGTLLAQAYQDRGLTHSVTLMPLLDGMLKTAGLTLDDMDIIAVAQGPGSFTGIRIGVSAAKGLAWAKALPCCGVSTRPAGSASACCSSPASRRGPVSTTCWKQPIPKNSASPVTR